MKFKTDRKFKQIGGPPISEEAKLRVRIKQLEDALQPFAELPVMEDDDEFSYMIQHARFVLKRQKRS